MVDKQMDYDFVDHKEITLGKIQALQCKIYKRNVVFINDMDAMQMITPFFELLCNFIEDESLQGLLLFADFEKSFDNISH